MRKLIIVLLAFFAVFTFIRTFENAEASASLPDVAIEIPVEIVR